jgi:hypothetical protein
VNGLNTNGHVRFAKIETGKVLAATGLHGVDGVM